MPQYARLNCLAGPGASGYPLQAPSFYLPLISNPSDPTNSTFWTQTAQLLRSVNSIPKEEPIDQFGEKDFHSGFNRIRLIAWSVRGMVLAAPAAPVKPWLSFRGEIANSGDGRGYVDTAAVLDYYQEMIFHVVLTGSPGFYFFNPDHCDGRMLSGTAARASDNSALSDSLTELTQLVGCSSSRKWVVDSSPPRLRDAMMLTGMQLDNAINNGGGVSPAKTTLWRLTVPPLAVGQTATGLVSSFGSDGSLQVGGLSLGGPNDTPQRGKGECVLVFPGPAHVVPGEASVTMGVWIRQTGVAVDPPFTQCTDAS